MALLWGRGCGEGGVVYVRGEWQLFWGRGFKKNGGVWTRRGGFTWGRGYEEGGVASIRVLLYERGRGSDYGGGSLWKGAWSQKAGVGLFCGRGFVKGCAV